MKRVVYGMCLLLVGACGGFWAWSSQPSRGTSTVQQSSDTEVKGASVVLDDIATNLFQTKTTSNLKFKTKSEAERAPIVGQYLLIDKDRYKSDQLAITVGTVKSQSVFDVSPVQFRKTLPQEYREVSPETGFPEGALAFAKVSGYEKSVFWIDGDKYVAVVASGGDDRAAELEESLKAAVQYFTWK